MCGQEGTWFHPSTLRRPNVVHRETDYPADVNTARDIADRYRLGESQPQTDHESGQTVAGDDGGQ